MRKEDKLKMAIDFIADYLSDKPKVVEGIEKSDVTNDVLIETESDDNLKRAYTLMKKLETRDKENAKINLVVKQAGNLTKEELKRAKAEHEDNGGPLYGILEKSLIERKKGGNEVGLTIDENTGKMIKVFVESLPKTIDDSSEKDLTHNID